MVRAKNGEKESGIRVKSKRNWKRGTPGRGGKTSVIATVNGEKEVAISVIGRLVKHRLDSKGLYNACKIFLFFPRVILTYRFKYF